jgi:uncharacterized short protein YbdD (DUF466 family)
MLMNILIAAIIIIATVGIHAYSNYVSHISIESVESYC